ncbi:MAG: hypothetical protein INF98_09740 [Roseomonas sp.]|nr:hypothetical protein [Roseomonas sp.]
MRKLESPVCDEEMFDCLREAMGAIDHFVAMAEMDLSQDTLALMAVQLAAARMIQNPHA